jgi:long-chain acyl-CoA synthetase
VEKVWIKSYENGVPNTIKLGSMKSLVSMFKDSCDKHQSKAAFVNMGTTITYGELYKKSYQFALFLQKNGLQKGDRVALMMPNILQYPITIFGTLMAGGVVVNTNPLYTAEELAYQLNDSGAEILVVMSNFAHTVQKAQPNIKTVRQIIITQMGDLFPLIKGCIINLVLKYIKKMIPPYSVANQIPFKKTLDKNSTTPLIEHTLSQKDMAFLQYTGGTTGISKGAILTHGNLLANLLQATAWAPSPPFNDKDTVVTALPLYHIFSLTANCLTFIYAGAKNILITNPRDIPQFIQQIKNSGFTVITGVNTLFNALLSNPLLLKVDFSKLKIALSGGMALQKNVALKWNELTKSRILEAYGLTETSPAITINPLYLDKFNGSIGLPLPSTEVSIRNDEGKELGFNEPGELCVKGPQVMSGYWNKPEETALVMTEDGFLKTGDIAYIDEKGFIYLVDRKKDLIIISGFNVYPNEVEKVISMHPDVAEVGVIGVTDNYGNEQIKAYVVKRNPSLTSDQIITFCREHLTPYKIPKIIEFYSDLPKTNVGKILRRALREESK